MSPRPAPSRRPQRSVRKQRDVLRTARRGAAPRSLGPAQQPVRTQRVRGSSHGFPRCCPQWRPGSCRRSSATVPRRIHPIPRLLRDVNPTVVFASTAQLRNTVRDWADKSLVEHQHAWRCCLDDDFRRCVRRCGLPDRHGPRASTVVILRRAVVNGRRTGMATVLDNECGMLLWGLAAAFGLSALLLASQVAYDVIRMPARRCWCGWEHVPCGRRGELGSRIRHQRKQPRCRFGGRTGMRYLCTTPFCTLPHVCPSMPRRSARWELTRMSSVPAPKTRRASG